MSEEPGGVRLWTGPTGELAVRGWQARLRRMLDAAFDGNFADTDWEHALGGWHAVALDSGRPVGHASVVPRTIFVAGRGALRAGYVEAVATHPAYQGRGHGTRLMRAVASHLAGGYELGALSTGSSGFYERLGWRVWPGPTWVLTSTGPQRTAAEDGGVLVLTTPTTPVLDPTADIMCDWRIGDVW